MNSNKSTMTREEQRKARARVEQERYLAKVKKEKDWLAANPHIAAQQERDKEEQRKNRETIRMLQEMKEQELAQTKKKKPVNAFAALMDDSDSEDENENIDNHLECDTESKDLDWSNREESKDEPKKKFVWADECDD
jgi:hypothetical protein